MALVCLYSPKIYILLFHPDKNVRKLTMNSAAYRRGPITTTGGGSTGGANGGGSSTFAGCGLAGGSGGSGSEGGGTNGVSLHLEEKDTDVCESVQSSVNRRK